MAVDPYAPCPGGTGKKIKFCCADLTSELDKIRRMLEGEQRLACLEHITKLEEKYQDRACLMSVRAMLESQLGKTEAADATLTRFRGKYPDNPVALAETAMLQAAQGDARGAIAPLQRAIELSGNEMPARVYEAIGALSMMLVREGELLAARGWILLQAEIAGQGDRRPIQRLMQLNGSPQVPLLLKEEPHWAMAPEDAAWKNQFDQALGNALRGRWLAAAQQFEALIEQSPDEPALWKNLAIVRGWLADADGTIAASRRYASLPVEEESAIEAEALAQLLGEDTVGEDIDVLTATFSLADLPQFETRLSGDRAVRLAIDPAVMADENEPPPRSAYSLLDRPMPHSGAELQLDAVPEVLGSIYLFGKQTDRDARVELVATRTQIEQAKGVVKELAGDTLGAETGEEVTTQVPASANALSWNWRVPDDTPRERYAELVQQKRRQMLLERWPQVPMRLFDGKSPAEVADQAAYRVPLLAAILLLELSDTEAGAGSTYNELRAKLGLRALGTIDPGTVEVGELPLVRLHRLEVEKLGDEQLLQVYHRASFSRAENALRRILPQLVERPALRSRVDVAEIYGTLARLQTDYRKALEYLNQARQAAREAKKSTAPWDLEELQLQIQLGQGQEVARLVNSLQPHLREPGVAQALYSILADAGLINPDGSLPPAPQEGPSIVVPGAEQPGKIWTPGGEASGQTSKIWTPD